MNENEPHTITKKTNPRFLIKALLMRISAFCLLVAITACGSNISENNEQTNFHPIISESVKNDLSPQLKDIPASTPLQSGEIIEIPRFHPEWLYTSSPATDSLLQETLGSGAVIRMALGSMPAPLVSFEGTGNFNGVLPADTNGAIGPNHYVQMVNIAYQIFDRNGNSLLGPQNINTLWSGFGGACEFENDGDPVVLYDHLADRWLMSQFANQTGPPEYHECIAISQTGDPTGAWHRYDFLLSTNWINDYPKFGVWEDGYYMSANQFTKAGSYTGVAVYAFERDKMLDGLAAQYVGFDLGTVNLNYYSMLPADLDGPAPPPGTPNIFMEMEDNAWGFPQDQLSIWEFHVDWVNTANSTFGISGNPNASIPAASFDTNMCGYARNCIPQPGGTNVDAISDRLMYRLQFRDFGSYQTMVVNHTVDVDGTDHAGIRWYELRNSGSSWNIFQQGTHAPDSEHRWMGSAAMDGDGNIALGYSVSSTTTFPSIRYAGRLSNDPLNTLPQLEGEIIAGGGYQTHSSGRWGDYSSLTIDPNDDCTFWFTTEYYSTSGPAPWQTRVGAFKFPSCPTATPIDTDGDGMPDGWEYDNGFDPITNDAALDADSDNLSNFDEYLSGTDPNNPDTDSDFLLDGDESGLGTDPLTPDFDGDTILDGHEYYGGTDPTIWDPVCGPSLYCYGDQDGNGIATLNEIIAARDAASLNPGDYLMVFPSNGETLDINGDTIVSLSDLVILRDWTSLNPSPGAVPGIPSTITILSPADGTVLTLGTTVELEAEVRGTGGTLRPGVGVVFEVLSGPAILLGGRGNAELLIDPDTGINYPAGSRWSVTGDLISGATARMVVRREGAGTIQVRVRVPQSPAKQLASGISTTLTLN